MIWTLPGTTITAQRKDANIASAQFDSLFLAGGLTLSQVSSITGLEPYAIQNWVKRGFLSAPKGKRYSKEQLCRIITINMLKSIMPLEKICSMMQYINGDLADDSDDLIDDGMLYFMFVNLAARARHIGGSENWDVAIENAMSSYTETQPGAKERVEKVLRVMLTAWICSRFKAQVDEMVDSLK